MHIRFLILIICLYIPVCTMAQFTDKEKEIIHHGGISEPFRVLLLSNEQDSLILRKQSEDISPVKENEDLKLLIQRLKLTMQVESGVGIAAPQVGINKNIFIFTRIDHPDFPAAAAINPKIVGHPEETVCFEQDGCLSIPGISGNSLRYPWVEIEYTNEDGDIVKERLEGYSRTGNFTAVVFQHEFDHLRGVLFIDKLCPAAEE